VEQRGEGGAGQRRFRFFRFDRHRRTPLQNSLEDSLVTQRDTPKHRADYRVLGAAPGKRMHRPERGRCRFTGLLLAPAG
jgi:hypothetical protein